MGSRASPNEFPFLPQAKELLRRVREWIGEVRDKKEQLIFMTHVLSPHHYPCVKREVEVASCLLHLHDTRVGGV